MSSVPATSALLRLTPRDHRLVSVLDELRYLTAAQIQQVCYPTITVASASHRLSLLRRRGVVDCLTHRTFADRRAFWGLTARGRAAHAALRHHLGAASPHGARQDGSLAVAAVQMEHLIGVNQIFCELCREHRAARLGPFRWLGSHHSRVDLGHTHLVPDALILAASPSAEWWMYFLELDRHTMAERALAEKFERYALMYRIAATRPDDPAWQARADSWVVFACGHEQRAAMAARVATGCGLRRIWAGTVQECAAGLARAVRADGTGGGVMPPEPDLVDPQVGLRWEGL